MTLIKDFYATSLARPQSYITKGKQRLKQHNTDTVYLNNGDEFEIELFNPTNNKVLAKIELNGKSIGAGIIVRPGERVFLERYLDEAKKFLFETYLVNGEDKDVKNAIGSNGDVIVKFFDEMMPYTPIGNMLSISNSLATWSTNTGTHNYNPITYTTGNNVFYSNTSTGNGTLSGSITTSSATYNAPHASLNANLNTKVKSLETGRVEKGSNSKQSFTYDSAQFNSMYATTNWWKIKPQSTKVLVKEDLVTYCTECGSKRKKDSHKFCPSCGTKF